MLIEGSVCVYVCVCVCVCVRARASARTLSHIRLFVTPWTVARQAPLSMEFPWQEYWSCMTFPAQGELPDSRIEPSSPTVLVNSLPLAPPGKLWWVSNINNVAGYSDSSGDF